MAMTETSNPGSKLLVCTDHEEVGSVSSSGAQGTFYSRCWNALPAAMKTWGG